MHFICLYLCWDGFLLCILSWFLPHNVDQANLKLQSCCHRLSSAEIIASWGQGRLWRHGSRESAGNLFLMYYVCVCAYATMPLWRSGDNFWDAVLFFHHGTMGSRSKTRVIRLGQEMLFSVEPLPWPNIGTLCTVVSVFCEHRNIKNGKKKKTSLKIPGSQYWVQQAVVTVWQLS